MSSEIPATAKTQMETISYTLTPSLSICSPNINQKTFSKPFRPQDLERVLDFDDIQSTPPADSFLRVLIRDNFQEAYLRIRGGFILYKFQEQPEEYPPIACIPLERTLVEFPPGGRRAFKDHAAAAARQGYEFAILDGEQHIPENLKRPRAYILAESNQQREEWAGAIRLRSELRNRDTKLRPKSEKEQETKRNLRKHAFDEENMDFDPAWKQEKKPEFLDDATRIFGRSDYKEESYVTDFYTENEELKCNEKVRELEKFHGSVKLGLRGKVLEQYRYFVEASREMTVMGKEVSALREVVEGHVRCIQTMKAIDFGVVTLEGEDFSESEEEIGMLEGEESSEGSSDDSSTEDFRVVARKSKKGTITRQGSLQSLDGEVVGAIQIPEWLSDVVDEITVLIRQCLYSDATELILKSNAELDEILSMHEKLPTHRLTAKQHAQIQQTLQSIQSQSSRMGDRLSACLRRKNEALRQSAKRERADPLSEVAPLLSPICLNDDSSALVLLIKMGRAQDAATAYSVRRSLLLMESLGERPITSSGTMDVVIYTAQLSQGFFSCLATAVEGFLDLFLESNHDDPGTTDIDEHDSIETGLDAGKVPAGALASIVLWCDAELSKFASVFGGQKILGHLALSPAQKPSEGKPANKDRKMAIEIASKCVDQAFQLASENLDAIGLPLSPRLADYVRGRLKGCEKEIASLLKGKWDHIIYDWLAPVRPIEGERERKGIHHRTPSSFEE